MNATIKRGGGKKFVVRNLVAAMSVLVLNTGLVTPVLAEGFQLEEIVVTATKRTENLQDVGATVRALGAEQLESVDVQTIADIVNLLPNVQIKGHPSEEITIRGVSQSRLGQSPVSRHVNGIFKYDHWSYLGVFYDIENVEVIQGPTGTVYGRNATAGAINVIQRKPTAELDSAAEFTFGNYDQRQFRGMVNVPFFGEGNESLMGRLVVQREERDGYVDNLESSKHDLQSADDTFVRGSLRSIFEDTEITVRGFWSERKGDYEGGRLIGNQNPIGNVPSTPLPFDPFGGLAIFQAVAADPMVLGGVAMANQADNPGFTFEQALQDVLVNGYAPFGVDPILSSDEYFTSIAPLTSDVREVRSRIFELGEPVWKVYGVDGELVHSLDGMTLNVLGGWERTSRLQLSDVDGTELAIVDVMQEWETDLYNAEVRLTSDTDDALSWIVGAFYFYRDHDQQGDSYIPLGVFTVNTKLQEDGIGLFVSGNYKFGDAFEVFGGLRWNRDSVDLEESNISFGVTQSLKDDDSFTETTGELGVKYFISEDDMVYLKFTRGYKAGSIELLNNGEVNSVDPELIAALESGLRTEWLDNRLRVNLTGFYYDYTDLQVPIVTAFEEFTRNAGEATIWGVELDATYLITPEWTMSVSVGHLNAEFDEFCAVDDYQGITVTDPACVAGPGEDPVADGTLDLSDHKLEDAPEWKATLYTSYDLSLGDYGSLKSVAQVTWTDDYYLRPFNADIDKVEAFAKTDLRLIWDSPSTVYSVEAFVENLENKTRYSRVVTLSDFTGYAPVGFGVIPPRTYGVRFVYNFGGK